ncbi:MAG: hypothetical protein E7057_10445 [Lentisphaerae bacterium]|nr:hypothetical protein [Lentisphaerota bacterium]
MKKVITILAMLFTLGVFAGEVVVVPTVAVLPFESRDRQAASTDMGKSVAELLNIALMESGNADMVERAELDAALNELQLSATGLTSKESQVKLGRFIGAKILITGSLFKSGSKNFVIAKIIGTETSRVLGASASGTEDFTSLVPMLAPKVSAILEKQSAKLLPKELNKEDVLSRLKKVVQGKQRKVFVKVKEDIAVSVPDPAAETELKKLLLALDFQVVNTRNEADYAVIGEAIAANAGSYHKFTSAAARLELSVYNKDKKLLATGAARETLAGASYPIAAKEAIARTALKLAGEFFPVMK